MHFLTFQMGVSIMSLCSLVRPVVWDRALAGMGGCLAMLAPPEEATVLDPDPQSPAASVTCHRAVLGRHQTGVWASGAHRQEVAHRVERKPGQELCGAPRLFVLTQELVQ